MAMVLDDCLGSHEWSVFGSDISARVLERARRGHYPLERARLIPPAYLKRYCRKGQGPQEGTLLVARELRARAGFGQVNLNATLPTLGGSFDVIFLRNVMIYFSADTKRQVLARVLAQLRPGGVLCVGLSETLADLADGVEQVAPATYVKVA
jgi:chemotaxis protein methyltransferase CheR